MNPPAMALPENDLDYILMHTITLWEDLRNQSIFITGGTGFFGCWLLESFAWANKKLNLNATAVILTRNPEQFRRKCPHLFLDSSLVFYEGDVRNFIFPQGRFNYIIHAATEASVSLNRENPDLIFETIVQGTKHTLNFSVHAAVKGFLLISSGAIYGKQPSIISHLAEDYSYLSVNSDEDKSAYAEGKRRAEDICRQYAKHADLQIKIARCFAFVGPHIPLDTHFAIGNFIRDGLEGKAIEVNGDGSPYRSYLYAADLAIWLWTILFRGETMRPYNVGSEEALTIEELAHRVAKVFKSKIDVRIKQSTTSHKNERYVPKINRARDELGLTSEINLDQALQSTINWYARWREVNDAN